MFDRESSGYSGFAAAPAAAGAFSLSGFGVLLAVPSDDSDLAVESLEPLELLDLRLSVMYQPEPLNWKAGDDTRRRDSFPQFGQS